MLVCVYVTESDDCCINKSLHREWKKTQFVQFCEELYSDASLVMYFLTSSMAMKISNMAKQDILGTLS